MGHTFISYCTENQTFADEMKSLLKKHGVETWIASENIPAGGKFAQEINRAIKECSCFLLILSEDAQNSNWVPREVERAVNYCKPIITVKIEDVVLNDEFELYISTEQIISVQKLDPNSDAIKKILDSIISFSNIKKTENVQIGSILDNRYQILSEIGRGGFSEVYLAENIRTKKKWAIKVINNIANMKYKQFLNMLSNEMSLLNKLNHPGLPSIADIFQTENQFIVVMDYIEGVSFDRIISEKGALKENYVIYLAKQLCDILKYLHKQMIIYNGLCPSNIMLMPDDRIFLIDFGNALNISTTPKENNSVLRGTLYYTAPESYSGVFDKRTDIFSLGMTLYAMVIGKHLSDMPCTDAMNNPFSNVDTKVSLGLKYIIEKCIKRNPRARYQDVRELLIDLNQVDELSSKLNKRKRFHLSLKK